MALQMLFPTENKTTENTYINATIPFIFLNYLLTPKLKYIQQLSSDALLLSPTTLLIVFNRNYPPWVKPQASHSKYCDCLQFYHAPLNICFTQYFKLLSAFFIGFGCKGTKSTSLSKAFVSRMNLERWKVFISKTCIPGDISTTRRMDNQNRHESILAIASIPIILYSMHLCLENICSTISYYWRLASPGC